MFYYSITEEINKLLTQNELVVKKATFTDKLIIDVANINDNKVMKLVFQNPIIDNPNFEIHYSCLKEVHINNYSHTYRTKFFNVSKATFTDKKENALTIVEGL